MVANSKLEDEAQQWTREFLEKGITMGSKRDGIMICRYPSMVSHVRPPIIKANSDGATPPVPRLETVASVSSYESLRKGSRASRAKDAMPLEAEAKRTLKPKKTARSAGNAGRGKVRGTAVEGRRRVVTRTKSRTLIKLRQPGDRQPR